MSSDFISKCLEAGHNAPQWAQFQTLLESEFAGVASAFEVCFVSCPPLPLLVSVEYVTVQTMDATQQALILSKLESQLAASPEYVAIKSAMTTEIDKVHMMYVYHLIGARDQTHCMSRLPRLEAR